MELEEGEHFRPRRPFNDHAPLRDDVLHVYGVDKLSTEDVVYCFQPFAKKVEWIDDSSCNVVFHDDETAKQVYADSPNEVIDEQWKTRPSVYGTTSGNKTAVLQVRPATYADVKDIGQTPGDSQYYALQVQKLEAQRARERTHREKKRQRGIAFQEKIAREREAKQEARDAKRAAAQAKAEAAGTGILASRPFSMTDPLLYLKVSQAGSSAASGDAETAGQKPEADLKSLVQAQEQAQIAAVAVPLHGGSSKGAGKGSSKGGGKGREKGANKRTRADMKADDARFEKTLREFAGQPRSGVKTFPAVWTFIKRNAVKCEILRVDHTYRELKRARKGKPAKMGEVWVDYITKNQLDTVQLVHSLHFRLTQPGEDPKLVIVMVPQGTMVDQAKVAKALQVERPCVKMLNVVQVQESTGLPSNVVPPFGYEFLFRPPGPKGTGKGGKKGGDQPAAMEVDTSGDKPSAAVVECETPKEAPQVAEPPVKPSPVTLVDSTIMECKKSLLFDCGTTAIRIAPSELLRACKASPVEGLAVTPPPRTNG